MATTHGSEGVVKIGTNTVAEVVDFTLTETTAFAEDTNLAATDTTYNATAIKSASGSITARWDETDTNGQEALTNGASVTLELYPGGESTTGASMTARINEVGVTNQRGEVVERTFGFVVSGGVTWS